jgi:hypothetical protein
LPPTLTLGRERQCFRLYNYPASPMRSESTHANHN